MKELSLREIQQEITKWGLQQFGYENKSLFVGDPACGTPMGSILQLCGAFTELAEIMRPMIEMHQGRWNKKVTESERNAALRETYEDGAADLLIWFCHWAGLNHIDLQEVLNRVWHEKVQYRTQKDWEKIKAEEDGKSVQKIRPQGRHPATLTVGEERVFNLPQLETQVYGYVKSIEGVSEGQYLVTIQALDKPNLVPTVGLYQVDEEGFEKRLGNLRNDHERILPKSPYTPHVDAPPAIGLMPDTYRHSCCEAMSEKQREDFARHLEKEVDQPIIKANQETVLRQGGFKTPTKDKGEGGPKPAAGCPECKTKFSDRMPKFCPECGYHLHPLDRVE